MNREPGCSSSNIFSYNADCNTGVAGVADAGGVRGYGGGLEDSHRNESLMQTTSEAQDILHGPVSSLPQIGLRLQVTPLLDKIVQMIALPTRSTVSESAQEVNHPADRSTNAFVSRPEKLKAANFPISSIKIGAWKRKSMHEGDLVAKCYFAKKKLVWELLNKGLKSKIEIQWCDIIGLRFITREKELGHLDIELRSPPSFHGEVDPMPRKHTVWRVSEDFTGGEATRCRIHHLRFPPGILEKQIEKLLQCEPRLRRLSRQRFPTIDNPYFDSNTFDLRDYPFNYPQYGPEISFRPGFSRGKTCHVESVPSPLVTSQPVQSYASKVNQPYLQETPSPTSAELMSKQVLENQRTTVWGSGFSNYADARPRDGLQRPVSVVPSNQVCQEPGYVAVAATSTQLSQMQSNILDNYSRGQLQEQIVPVPTHLGPIQGYSADQVQGLVTDDVQLNQVSPLQGYSSYGYPTDEGILSTVLLSQVSPSVSCLNHNMLTDDAQNETWYEKASMTRVASLTELAFGVQTSSENDDLAFGATENANKHMQFLPPLLLPQYPTMHREWNRLSSYEAFDVSGAAMFDNFKEQNHWNPDTLGPQS